MFELDAALRVVETHTCRIAPHLDGLDAQIRHAPHLVEYHLGIGCLHHLLHRLGRHPEHPLLLVDTADAVHLLKIVHIAADKGLYNVVLHGADYCAGGIAGYNAGGWCFAVADGSGIGVYFYHHILYAVYGAQSGLEGNAQRHGYHAETDFCDFHENLL